MPKRRGRPRSLLPRKNGRPVKPPAQTTDHGTPEQQARRQALLGGRWRQSLCLDSPIHRLHVEGLLTANHVETARRYQARHRLVWGAAHPRAVDLGAVRGRGEPPDEALERARAELDAWYDAAYRAEGVRGEYVLTRYVITEYAAPADPIVRAADARMLRSMLEAMAGGRRNGAQSRAEGG